MEDAGESSMMVEAPAHGVLGTLWLVGRKTGLDMQSFPIDADRVTIGRDIDCDVRLYFSDVSKLHCEIKFDLLTGQASLHVHGTHGLKYAPQGGDFATIKPPTILALSDRDTFVVRKKLFRFEYGHEEPHINTPTMETQPLPSDSPIKASASPARLPAPRRKRASHRMSLVPSGKMFEPLASPMKNRRHSIIGLGEGPQVICTPKKSRLANEIQEEDEEAEEEDEAIVEALDGEEGDIVYLEAREEEDNQRPIHQNAFMTPQQKRKAPLRNTSAVPRTRKMASSGKTTENAQYTAMAGMDSPKTPRSVPLPEGGQTPYASHESTPDAAKVIPRSVPLPPVSNTPYHVPAQVVMSTPRGPVSLHKALLLRSARKAWQSTQAQGIDGAIQSGDVSVRRKSLSPISRDSRKSLTPMPETAADNDDEENEEEQSDEEDEQEAETGEGELQWVYEDGSASVSVDESDSSIDSLEADQSLDIPGQGIISFSPAPAELPTIEVGQEDDTLEDLDQEEQQDEEMEDNEDEVAEDGHDQSTPLTRNLNRFYTPQPKRNTEMAAPRTLSSIGGPAVRFERIPETPSAGVTRVPATPRSLGPPSRRIVVEAPETDEGEEQDAVPSTPVRRELDIAMLEEAKRRRETLGTPRDLPAPPRSFKTPVREFPSRSARKTGPHPVLAVHTPEQEEAETDSGPIVPLTPVQSVQRKLDTLRRQSLKRQSVDANRRATVGFVLPSTPAQKRPPPSAAHTVAGNRRAPAPVPEESEVGSLPPTPTMAAVQSEGDISSIHAFTASPASVPTESHEVHQSETREIDPATPQYTGLKQMFRSVIPPKTPSFAGVRSMFASSSAAEQATPQYGGMKTMFQEPVTVATPELSGMKGMFAEPKAVSTPQLAGVRTMFQLPQDPATPAMDGLKEMYELEEVDDDAALQADTESEEEEEIEERSSVIVCAPPPPPIKVAASSSKTVASKTSASAPGKAPVRNTKSKLPTASAAARSTTAATGKAATATVRKTATTAAGRAAKADAPSAPKRAAPTAKKAAAPKAGPRPGDIDYVSESEVEEPLEYEEPSKTKPAPAKPARATASRAKKVEPAVAKEPASKPTRAKKAVLGENDDQPPAPAPAPAKATQGKSATTTAAKATTSASAPTRKPRTATAEKENEPASEPAVKKAPARRTVKKAEPAEEPVPVAAPTTRSRATRSKK